MNRRKAVAAILAFTLVSACSQKAPQSNPVEPQSGPVDSVAVYVVPTDGVPEQFAASIARTLTKETGLWVKSTVTVPAANIEPFAGTNQYPAEDYIALAGLMSDRLQDASAQTYFIVLTNRDINSRPRNFRFQFSLHNPLARASVLSLARLLHEKDGSQAPRQVFSARTQKMLMRIVGEMRLGWKRSNDPADLMYAPIMSTEDIDRMSLVHSGQRREPTQ
jgi:predicted Zn-dependent protease